MYRYFQILRRIFRWRIRFVAYLQISGWVTRNTTTTLSKQCITLGLKKNPTILNRSSKEFRQKLQHRVLTVLG